MLKITGLDEIQRKLEDMSRRAQSISGTQNVPIPELLTPEFLRQCSRFNSASDFFEASGFKVETSEDFAAIPDDEWDEFIRANTSYATWKTMMGEAVKGWTAKKMGF